MKKLLPFLLAATMILFWGCEDSPATKDPKVDTETTEVNLPSQSGSGSVTFETNHDWKVTLTPATSSAWLTVTPAAGNAGNNTISIKAIDNEGYDDRSATLKIESETASKSITILQKQKNAILVSKNKYEVPQEGGSVDIQVQSNIDYIVEIREQDKSWITDISSRALSSSAVKLSVAANTDYDGREGEVVIKERNGTLSETVKIFQNQKDALILTDKEFTVGHEGEEFDVELRSNTEYDVKWTASWIRKVGSRSMRTDHYTFAAEKHDGQDSRTATIVFKAKDSDTQDVLTVTQTPEGVVLVSQKEYNVQAEGENISVKVAANIEFDIIISSADSQWISNTTNLTDMQDYSYTFKIEKNESDGTRSGKITFKDKNSDLSDVVTVNQFGQSTLILTPDEINVDASRNIVSVELKRNVEYEIEFKDSWVRRNESTSSVITETVELVVDANGTYDPRSAQVIFKDKNGSLSQTLIINQEQKNALLISPTTYRVPATENIVTVTVSSNIPHTFEIPSDYGSWISSSSSGNTRGLTDNTYRFLIKEHTGSGERVGEIYFESAEYGIRQPVTIIQNGSAAATLTVSPTSISFQADETGPKNVTVTANKNTWTYNVTSDGNWCNVTKTGNTLQVYAASQNTQTSPRYATLTVSLESITRTISITQAGVQSSGNYTDGQVVKLQSATVGNGIDIVILGDGFTEDHMARGGNYETSMKLAMEHFFSVYPYNVYRNYFNVYMVVGVSAEAGVSGDPATGNRTINNKFSTRYGSGTYISGDDALVRTYAGYAIGYDNTSTAMVIAVLNSPKYAGTCWMYYDGFSIGYCPMSTDPSPNYDFKALVVHECGGHGFAHLIDEYIYNYSDITTSRKNDIISVQNTYDWYRNVDFTSNLSQIHWKDFIGNSKYSMVGAYEGAAQYAYGIWRPEFNSCMNNNVDYFNAPSRWAIVKRIMQLAGQSYTIQQFMIDDQIIPASYAPSLTMVEEFIPLAPPVAREWNY